VPLNVLFKPREIAYHLQDSDARAYFCFEGTAELPTGQWGREAFDQVEGCRHFVRLTIDPMTLTAPGGERTLAAFIGPEPAEFPAVPTRADDTAVILYTSGTTGQPKGAELTHANLFLNASITAGLGASFLDRAPGARNASLVTLPLFHSFGQVTQMAVAALQGTTIVLLPRFEPAADIHAASVRVARHHLAYTPPILIDARMKPWYPAELSCRPDVAARVTRRWREYFPAGSVEMGDSDRAHLA
ncbi:AMP-binding protein, partial [Alicyclobacillus sp.]|uniref:AMP-binding protein n=1 Tax=Alicyclobacillus sp. TaxID=61169 RepID=UPI0025C71B34